MSGEAAALLAGVKWDEEPPRPAQDAVREAAETISRIYFEIAAEEGGEDWVRAEFKRRFAAARAAQGGE